MIPLTTFDSALMFGDGDVSFADAESGIARFRLFHVESPEDMPNRAGVDEPPTPAQKEAGNYEKVHITWNSLDISIENEKGTPRSKEDADGKTIWKVDEMPADYGYIRGTTGKDGDHVDCYVGPDPSAPKVWVICQVRIPLRTLDEHKCMLGFASKKDAVNCYILGFSDGKGNERIGEVREMTVDEFKAWLPKAQDEKLANGGPGSGSWNGPGQPRFIFSPAAQKVWDDLKSAKDEFVGVDASHLTPEDRRMLAKSGLSFTEDRNRKPVAHYPARLRQDDLRAKVAGSRLKGADITTPEFKEWFGKSKVVDKDGKPKVMYHGSTADFSEFNPVKGVADGHGAQGAAAGKAIFLADDPEHSNHYAQGEGGNITPTFVRMENPFIPDASFGNNIGLAIWEAKERGHDGLIMSGPDDSTGKVRSIYVVFDSTQIKSTFNRGTWSKTDKNIANAPGDNEGGLGEDLLPAYRRDLILRTTSQITQGYIHWREGQNQDDLDLWPYTELYRAEMRIEPRDWPDRWAEAGGQFYDGDSDYPEGRMIARKDDPIWYRLGPFGNPFPPFDFNSGMGLKDISKEEAIELGIMGENDELPEPVEWTLAESIKTPVDLDDDTRQQVKEMLGKDWKFFDGELVFVGNDPPTRFGNRAKPEPAPEPKLIQPDFSEITDAIAKIPKLIADGIKSAPSTKVYTPKTIVKSKDHPQPVAFEIERDKHGRMVRIVPKYL